MTYTVKYRGADGALKSEVVEAASRGAALSQLKARGITPTSVAEGGKLSSAAPSTVSLSARPAWIKGAIAGLIVVVIAAVALFCLLPSGKPSVQKVEKPKNVKVEKPILAPRTRVGTSPDQTNIVKIVAAVPPESEFNSEKYPGEKIVSVITNSDHIVEISMKPNGRRTKHIVTPPSIWESATDGLLEMALNVPDDREMPPMPNMGVGMDQEFLESLKKPIRILPTDDENTVAVKKIVSAARDDVKERLENGEHFCDIINSHRELKNENGRIRGDIMRELHAIEKSGDVEGARKYKNTMNVALSQMGIAPIDSGEESNRKLNVKQMRKLK